MSSPIELLPGALAQLFADVSLTREMTLADRYGLMAAMFHEGLSEEERAAMNRLLRAACRGQLTLVQEVPSHTRLSRPFFRG